MSKSKSFVWAVDEKGNPCKCYASEENRGKGKCHHFCHAEEGKNFQETLDNLAHAQKKRICFNEQIHINDHDKDHVRNEKNILAAFPVGEKVHINGKNYLVENAGLPQEQENGNCKTDVYVRLKDDNDNLEEYKLSIKQSNYVYIENHMREHRIRSLFDKGGKEFSEEAINEKTEEWKAKKSNAKINKDHTVISIPFAYEYMLKRPDMPANEDTQLLEDLPRETLENIYAGTHLSEGKKHTNIGPDVIQDSGVANYYLVADCAYRIPSAEEVINNAEKMDDNFYKHHNSLGLQTKTVNIRIKEENGKFYSHSLSGSQLCRRDITYKDGRMDISNEIYSNDPDYITQDINGKAGWNNIAGWKKMDKEEHKKKKWDEIVEDSILGKVVKENQPKTLDELYNYIKH